MEKDNLGRDPAIRISLRPKDVNAHGTVFGGVILSYLDLAGAIIARPHAPSRLVTVAMKEVEFHEPVFVGDIVSFYGYVVRLGTTSVTVHLEVVAERYREPGRMVKVTEAEVVYVSVDDAFNKLPLLRPGS